MHRPLKWILRGFLAVVALAAGGVGLLWLLSHRSGANMVVETIEFARPPSTVWPWITEPQRMKQWIGGLAEMSGTGGPPAIGQKAREVMVINGRRTVMTSEVTDFETNRSLHVRLTSDGFEMPVQYTLIDLGGGRSRLDYRAVVRFDLPWVQLLEPLIMPEARRKGEADLGHLQQLVEAGG